MAEEFFRYVPIERERAYADHGWITIAHIGRVRGIENAVMMEWAATGAPRDPPPREHAAGTTGTRRRYEGEPPEEEDD